jgi:hypothetical protein
MKASLERWVRTGSSGDAALDARFAAMRAGQPQQAAPSPAAAQPEAPKGAAHAHGDDPRTNALVRALEGGASPANGGDP